LAGLIFFLTGCATGRYDKHSASPPSGAVYAPADQQFLWPLKGEVAVPYGAPDRGAPAKGIVIRSARGGDVVASRDGRVRYVDESLRGYGKTIVIEHTPQFSTVYAGIAEILVRPGQQVRQGEPVARQAAAAGPARLYFEIRKESKAVDPAPYLR
jgi:septal ring factor EnvC (AmiA/AmiB activator)